MNPNRWNGFSEQPETIKTDNYVDDNEFDIKKEKHHIEININTDAEPVLRVNLVNNDETVGTCHTNTLNSSYILSLMIQHLLKESESAA